MYVISILETAHAKSHAQTASVRKAANDKAREDRAIARDYQKKKAERRKNWLRYVIRLHKENPDIEPNLENQISEENKNEEQKLSLLKPQ